MAAVREAPADMAADREDSIQRRGEEGSNTGDSMEQEGDGKGKNAPYLTTKMPRAGGGHNGPLPNSSINSSVNS
jgi:hypothetical protein